MDEVNERLAQILDRTGDFRILRRVPEPVISIMTDADRAAAGLATAIVLDTETTGLSDDGEVFELAMAKVAFNPVVARIDHVVGTFSGLREPSRPITRGAARLTGISDGDVAGCSIDPDHVGNFVGGASMGADAKVVDAEALWNAAELVERRRGPHGRRLLRQAVG